MKRILVVVCTVILLPAVALAQNATVSGTVADQSGALIPGVEVTAENVNTGVPQLQITNESGVYSFASLQPGEYTVSASLPGFQTQIYEAVRLSQAQQVRLNFQLQIAEVGTNVEVVVEADTLLATTSASIGDRLPELEVSSLPLAVRDVLRLTETTGGAVGRNFAGQGIRSLNITRDGLSVNDTRYGADQQNGTYVSPDLVEEVQVVVGSIDAASGRGSGRVTLQTRSGTNEFHGALFYLNNNSALNAQNWFDNLVGAEKAYVNRSQFGGRLGGPIIRNKAFFFILIENQRYLQRSSYTTPVMTAEARQGIFRYIEGQDNANALQSNPSVDLQGNVLNPGALRSIDLFADVNDPFRTQITTVPYWRDILLTHQPLPNDFTVGDGLNIAGHRWVRRSNGVAGGNTVGNDNNRDQLNLRFDYQINDVHKASFTMSREDVWANRVREWPTGFDGEDRYLPQVWTTQLVSTLSPTVLNEFRVGRSQGGFRRLSPLTLGCCEGGNDFDFTVRSPEAQALWDSLPQVNGFPVIPQSNLTRPGTPGRSTISPDAYIRQRFDSTRGTRNPTLQIADSVSWTQGNHSFSTGFEFTNQFGNNFNSTSEQFPIAAMGAGPTPIVGIARAGLTSRNVSQAEDILEDLSGSVNTLTQGFIINRSDQTEWGTILDEGPRRRTTESNDFAFYFKNTWNVTNNLTVNLGVRYEKYGVLFEQAGLLPTGVGGGTAAFGISGTGFDALWDPNASGGSLTEIELVGKNSPHPDRHLYGDDWNNWGPSVGFSYNMPWFDRPTILRGGYGVNYAGAPVILDYELAFHGNPGTVDMELQSPSTAGFNYLDLEGVIANGVYPLTPSVAAPNPSGTVTVPLTDRSQTLHTSIAKRATPYIQNFTLGVQRELTRDLTLEVTYTGNKATKLYSNTEVNEVNIFENGILEAFNSVRAGGESPLFDQMLDGLSIGGGVVGVGGHTGAAALRNFGATDNWVADGEVAALADFLNRSSSVTGVPGGFLRNGNFSENFIVVNPQFRFVELWGADRNSNYHSLRVQLRKQVSRGLSAQLTYTWSKGLGDAINSAIRSATNRIDPRNQARNHGRLGFDRTHAINAHGTWTLPFGPNAALLSGAPNWVHRIVEGWQLSTILTYTSGEPLTPTTSVNTLGQTRNVAVPDAVGSIDKGLGGVRVGDGFIEYFEGLSSVPAPTPDFGTDPDNLAAHFGNRVIVDGSGNTLLANPEPGVAGTLGAQYLEGPGKLGLDVSMAKSVQLTEGMTFMLRADAVNMLNTPQWGNPNVNIESSSFGRITSAEGARTVTISGRIDF